MTNDSVIDEQEKKILKFWKEKDIYKRVKKRNSSGKKIYFMDGPPYATGNIHMGTALNKVLKDIATRYGRLRGYDVFDRPGYDTHGLPIENKVEKKLGFNSKEEIEKYGVKKFIDKCKRFATEYIGVMNEEFMNLGVWMDFDNPYLTLDKDYIESIWDTFKKAYEKKLLYLGKYPVHACPHCETAVAYNEIEYEKKTDLAVYVKFPLLNEKNKYLIIWTTTPWTLPSNTGVMVNPKFDYVEIESGKETWIVAKGRLQEFEKRTGKKYRVKKTIKGKSLSGIRYENPLIKYLNLPKLNDGYWVILNERYVNLDEGTGLVHTAPGCGKEDFEAGQKAHLPLLSLVNIEGKFDREAGKYSGEKASIANKEIVKDLEHDGFLVHKESYTHDYPVCWRCKSQLLMISVPQWFFKISEIKSKLIKSNDEVNWIPDYMKLRMKAWIEGISDWPISRNRYWGTPLPIWRCNKCDEQKVIGSIEELEKISKKKVVEVHKPEIDEITWKCKCGGIMKRVPEVLDVWFDSGVSSWAALGYPQNKKLFDEFWPADLNIEGKDQFRGWWNSQLILSEIRFGKRPYKSIVVHGMVLDIGKIKMSKSLGNIISPQDIIKKYGRDMLRYYFAKISKGEDFAFNEYEFKDIQRLFRVITNINNYLDMIKSQKTTQKINLEDKWILSKFNSFLSSVEKSYDSFRFPEVTQKIEDFVVNDLSKTYIQIIRDREGEVFDVLREIRDKLLAIIAPIMPFIAEETWIKLFHEKLVKEESIYLSSWPKIDSRKIDKNLEGRFNMIMGIIESGLAARDKAGINLRWPLTSATIMGEGLKLKKEDEEIIMNQLNVKKIIYKESSVDKKDISVNLDTTQNIELESEGYAREISRQIQAFRKKLGLEKSQKVETIILTDDGFAKVLESQKQYIQDRTNSKKLEVRISGKETFKNITDFSIKEKRGKIAIIVTKR